MTKLAKIEKVEEKVELILREFPETRNDDFVLISTFKDFYFEGYTWGQVFTQHSEIDFPSFETITRCRRKLQAVYPDLQAKKVAELRAEMEQQFEKYALSKNA